MWFTTGSNSGGYGLSSVDVYAAMQSGSPTPLVEIYEDNAGNPGTLHATLSSPATVTNSSVNTFTATNTTLSATTTYWLVTSNSATIGNSSNQGVGFRISLTPNTTADTGAATGWSIGNARFKGDITEVAWGSSSNHIIFTIRGTLGTTTVTTSSDATLSALALEDASDDSAIAISPVFASGTTSYTASVLNGVPEITIAPTVNESNATVEYLDSSDTAIADANSGKTGQQVSLSEGENTIKVKVTAQDATTNTYTVVVTRAANTPATGEPAIIGTARVGRTLTASDLDIMDVDGLPSASTFTYQWLRKVGATSTSISGANSSTYTLQTADLGNKVAVRVSFIDRAGNSEMRTSGDYPTSGTVLANNTLVSNVGQTLSASGNLTTDDLAQSFTTGANATGYTLSNIELRLSSASRCQC